MLLWEFVAFLEGYPATISKILLLKSTLLWLKVKQGDSNTLQVARFL